ncbi:hypothetical protein [Aliiglaciecola sp. LCG003]|uniref:hypothetical protein n=1 Tax=Aliiglaciecola sp. LCG003 TaxID=3053655 RepID=UPI0025723517|nr:hypothetical protein [Aliiglaciecola sp. LCG003]WJG07708.1 hypothetical protein QR722_10030 [Aliiglaciecola sp. LCG003]
MALLHSTDITELNPAYNKLHFQNFKALNGLSHLPESKWMYLLSNNIAFNSDVDGAIRLKKPNDEILFVWLEKIVEGGQCSILFVEELHLDDLRIQRLKYLCELHYVTLVNLTLDSATPKNLVVGPWN